MRIAFIGIEKDWLDLERRNYVRQFIQYHLELPYYYAVYGFNSVDIVSDYAWGPVMTFQDASPVEVLRYDEFLKREYDVVIHWRKWFEECHRPEAINVINSQDHSYGREWLQTVESATVDDKLYGILCFPTWHERNIAEECIRMPVAPRLLPGVTLGVDTSIYQPSPEKNRHQLLWASDPGRGIQEAYEITMMLFQRDKRFRLHVCWPDYVNLQYDIGGELQSGMIKVIHPAIVYHDNLDNGPELWNLFNTSGFLPYTSIFKEPSSRAHRQAMAAGCVVLYPPDMGTPSELIQPGVDGIVCDVEHWVSLIDQYANANEYHYELISNNARTRAVAENWRVQAQRFNKLFEGIING